MRHCRAGDTVSCSASVAGEPGGAALRRNHAAPSRRYHSSTLLVTSRRGTSTLLVHFAHTSSALVCNLTHLDPTGACFLCLASTHPRWQHVRLCTKRMLSAPFAVPPTLYLVLTRLLASSCHASPVLVLSSPSRSFRLHPPPCRIANSYWRVRGRIC